MNDKPTEAIEVKRCDTYPLCDSITIDGWIEHHCKGDTLLSNVDISQTEPPDQCPLREKNVLITIKPQQ